MGLHNVKQSTFAMPTLRLMRASVQIDAVVRERFGDEGCRIFRLLLLKRQLEQKHVADSAMLPVKETRELLYRMFRAEYLELQEVAKTADHAPSRTFFLWRVRFRKTTSEPSRNAC